MNSQDEDLCSNDKQIRVQSWLKVSCSAAKGDFLFTKDEETDFLAHSKHTGSDQIGKTVLQSHASRIEWKR